MYKSDLTTKFTKSRLLCMWIFKELYGSNKLHSFSKILAHCIFVSVTRIVLWNVFGKDMWEKTIFVSKRSKRGGWKIGYVATCCFVILLFIDEVFIQENCFTKKLIRSFLWQITLNKYFWLVFDLFMSSIVNYVYISQGHSCVK